MVFASVRTRLAPAEVTRRAKPKGDPRKIAPISPPVYPRDNRYGRVIGAIPSSLSQIATGSCTRFSPKITRRTREYARKSHPYRPRFTRRMSRSFAHCATRKPRCHGATPVTRHQRGLPAALRVTEHVLQPARAARDGSCQDAILSAIPARPRCRDIAVRSNETRGRGQFGALSGTASDAVPFIIQPILARSTLSCS